MNYRAPNAQEEARKKQTAQALEAARFLLVRGQPFIGSILIRQNLVPVADSRCPTAATDGQNIFVNPKFYLHLSPEERCFALAHEVWHTIYLHFLRRRNRDRERFNAAADMEVNRMLCQEGFKAPKNILLPPEKWSALNAEEIYARLPKKDKRKAPFDVHLEPGDPCGGPGAPGQIPAPGAPVNEAAVIDPDYQVDFGNHPEEKVREMVVEAAVQYEKHRGYLPGNIARIVEQFRAGKLHWKELLTQFVTGCLGGSRRWLPPNRRYISSGLYLQSRRDTRLQAVLAIDTSGSTSGDLPRFAGELVNLLNSFGQYELRVICCDHKIQSVETFTQETPFDGHSVKFRGGGGTSFKPVFDYLKENPGEEQILIYFTDGYGDIPPKPTYPVLWVITHNGRNQVPWGSVIKLDKDSRHE